MHIIQIKDGGEKRRRIYHFPYCFTNGSIIGKKPNQFRFIKQMDREKQWVAPDIFATQRKMSTFASHLDGFVSTMGVTGDKITVVIRECSRVDHERNWTHITSLLERIFCLEVRDGA